MNLSKNDRKEIHDMYNGKCAFCGCDLGKGWHVWDIEPVATLVTSDGLFDTINTEMDNLLPACKPCGSLRIRSYSQKMSIEEFRKEVLESFRLLRYGGITATSYGRSIRFGLIIETGRELKFHFEMVEKNKAIPR